MKVRRSSRQSATIPTASMADIAFLLIIFFMVISGVEVDRTRVELPMAKNREEAEKGAAVVVLSKAADVDDLVYKFSDGREASRTVSGPEDIYLEASRLIYDDPGRQFIIKADGSVPYERVDELLDKLRQGGVVKVILLTAQWTEAGR